MPFKLILLIIICIIFCHIAVAQDRLDSLSTALPKSIKILRTWELEPILKEISGIAYIDPNRIACIQDEIGSIFIYNLSTKVIESETPFAPPGDYEGIAVVNDDAYVACADGRLYEIANYRSEKPVVREYGTHLTVKQNVEGLCYDGVNKRLLVAIKGNEEGSPAYKGIYSFDLTTKTMPVKPVFKINLEDSVFGNIQGKRLQSVINPSDLDIHPSTGDIYITDGKRSQLLILDANGKIKNLLALGRFDFIQPEGMMFTPSGEFFIASEGNKQVPAKLALVEIN